MQHPLNHITREDKNWIYIEENGIEYKCRKNGGVIAGNLLVAIFHADGKTFLVECIQDRETLKETYRSFVRQEDMDNAWEMYVDIMDCM